MEKSKLAKVQLKYVCDFLLKWKKKNQKLEFFKIASIEFLQELIISETTHLIFLKKDGAELSTLASAGLM